MSEMTSLTIWDSFMKICAFPKMMVQKSRGKNWISGQIFTFFIFALKSFNIVYRKHVTQFRKCQKILNKYKNRKVVLEVGQYM